MPSSLSINVQDLLRFRGIESARVEFKADWNDGPTSWQVLHAICAFANDIYHLNGGYVVLGVEAARGVAELPPRGIDPSRLEEISQRIRVLCETRMEPPYYPIVSPEIVDGRYILVVWAPGSEARPHRAAESEARGASREYYVRQNAETRRALGPLRQQLLELTATVPFDDRRALGHSVDEVRAYLVRDFLRAVGSSLADEPDDHEVYRRMRLISRVNGHEVPKNIALLFFTEQPEDAFPGARIEVVYFPEGRGGDVIREVPPFRGPLANQIRACLEHLRPLSTSFIRKVADRAEAESWARYPLAAVEEAVVNAIYHRGYDGVYEPTKVYIYNDRIEITNYPGPVAGIRPEHFAPGASLPNVPARNRRIGELLKELKLTEQRGTGVAKILRAMERNGSPPPRFQFDDDRTYLTVVLPAHPDNPAESAS